MTQQCKHDFFESWDRITAGFSLEERGAYAEICGLALRTGKPVHEDHAARILNVNARRWKRLKQRLLEADALAIGENGEIVPHVLNGRPKKQGYLYKKDPISAILRWRVFRRDNYRCVQCGAWADLTVDHITAEREGGKTVEDNLQTLCRPCNSSKGAE